MQANAVVVKLILVSVESLHFDAFCVRIGILNQVLSDDESSCLKGAGSITVW